MGIGKQLSHILINKGLTVAEVARETGINPQTLYAIIKRDNDKVDAEILRDLVIYFNIDIYELLGFEPAGEDFDVNDEDNWLIDIVAGKAYELSDEGRKKVIEYEDDLILSGKYTREDDKK